MNKEQATNVFERIDSDYKSMVKGLKENSEWLRKTGDEQAAKKYDLAIEDATQLRNKAKNEYENGEYENLGEYIKKIMYIYMR